MSREEHEKATNQKLEQLRALKEGRITSYDLINEITERRVRWMRKNLDKMRSKYGKLPLPEQAYRIIFFEHMGIIPLMSKIAKQTPLSLEIHSYNFCPYLEACKKLFLSTRDICKNILEPPINEMIKVISPNLHFGRDYNNIRDHNANSLQSFCKEFIWQAG